MSKLENFCVVGGFLLIILALAYAQDLNVNAEVLGASEPITYSTIDNNNVWKSADFNLTINDVNFNVSDKNFAIYNIDGNGWVDFTLFDLNNYSVPITVDGNHSVLISFRNNAGSDLNLSLRALLGKTPASLVSKTPAIDFNSSTTTQPFVFNLSSLTPLASCEITLLDNDSNNVVSTNNVVPSSLGGNNYSCSKTFSNLALGTYRVTVKATNLADVNSSVFNSPVFTIYQEPAINLGGGGGGGGTPTGSFTVTSGDNNNVNGIYSLTGTQSDLNTTIIYISKGEKVVHNFNVSNTSNYNLLITVMSTKIDGLVVSTVGFNGVVEAGETVSVPVQFDNNTNLDNQTVVLTFSNGSTSVQKYVLFKNKINFDWAWILILVGALMLLAGLFMKQGDNSLLLTGIGLAVMLAGLYLTFMM